MQLTISKKTLKIVSFSIVILLAFWGFQSLLSSSNSVKGSNSATEESVQKVDKIEVIHFHATQQCWSCVTVAEFAEKSIQNRFPKELESGKILFKSLNYELPENAEITQKYKAYGSSLFINLIYDGKDHISEDVNVWRLINSEIQFEKYLGDKLEKYL